MGPMGLDEGMAKEGHADKEGFRIPGSPFLEEWRQWMLRNLQFFIYYLQNPELDIMDLGGEGEPSSSQNEVSAKMSYQE